MWIMKSLNCLRNAISSVIVVLQKQVFISYTMINSQIINSYEMIGGKCQLAESDSAPRVDNEENKYTHNYDGKYCVCNKEYKENVDVMLRCVVCEDWFHEHCIQEMIRVSKCNY
jgi:hypothetical protein